MNQIIHTIPGLGLSEKHWVSENDDSWQQCWSGFFSDLEEIHWSGWKVQKHLNMYTAESWYRGSDSWRAVCAVTPGLEEGAWVDVMPVMSWPGWGEAWRTAWGTSWVNASGQLLVFRDAGRNSASVSWIRAICSSLENPLGVTGL